MTSLVLIMALFLRRRRTFFRRMRLMALQTRRMRRNAVMLSIQQQNNINHRKRKTMWVYPRPQFWLEQLVVNHYQDHLWREHFRVSRDTFEYICGLVGPQLIRQNTILRQAITVVNTVGRLIGMRLSLRAMRLAAALTRTSYTISRVSITWREFPVIKAR